MKWGWPIAAATGLLVLAATGWADEQRGGGDKASRAETIATREAQAFARWPFRVRRESRPVPPRAIPGGRPAAIARPQMPLPRPRPDDVTGSIKIVPVAPLE